MALPNRTSLRFATANIMLLVNAFVWYLLAFDTIKDLLPQQDTTLLTLQIIGINTLSIVLSAFAGSFLFDKFKKRGNFLLIWLASGVFLSVIPLGLNASSFSGLVIISAVFGVYFGIGMPATMGYHAVVTTVENRAKVSGISFLIIGITFAILGLVVFDSLIASCLILAFIRLIGLVFFYLLKGKEELIKQTSKVKYTKIIFNKSFALYFIPWLLFTLINFMTMPIQGKIFTTNSEQYALLVAMENIVTAVVAVICGLVADKWGRKRLSILGFVMLGIGYAVIGIYSINNADLLLGSIIYFVADGIAWGIFFVLFVFTLWGDLAQNGRSDKFYFLGALPYISSYFMQLLFTPFLSQADPSTIFPFASVFLFLAVLPLIYAPETLPEKIMKDRDLKSYIENAKKKASKETEKIGKKQKRTRKENEEANEPTESDKNYEDAKKLAEKYY